MHDCPICGATTREALIGRWIYAICTANTDHIEEIDRYGD